MKVMRFTGRTSGEAMRKLRDALGAEALVLANRRCEGGVELLAAAPEALAGVGPTVVPARGDSTGADAVGTATTRPAASGERADEGVVDAPAGMSTVSFQDYVRQRLRERQRGRRDAEGEVRTASPIGPHRSVPIPAPAPARGSARVTAPAVRRVDDPPAALARAGWPIDDDLGRHAVAPRDADGAPTDAPIDHTTLVAELRSLRGMISNQFATTHWFEGVRRSPVQGRLMRTMVAAGFSLKLARSIVAKLPAEFGERDALGWLEQVVARNLRCATPAEAFEGAGVYALVGPTGVGKTTTTAKIAARHVLAHGAQSVALITVDTYRLGAHDQLRAFGRILGVPVHVAHDASALHDLLRLRGTRQLVLVDTVGMGHRDERIGSLLMSLPRTDIRHVVVASCASQAETIDESLRAFGARQAHGVVLTKTDEAARLGGALDCLLRQRLRLLGTCDGQRVPEDWHAADASRLARAAFLAPSGGAFALEDEELPLVFGVAATLQGDLAHA